MKSKKSTPQQAAQFIQSNQRIFFQGAAMTPSLLIDAICERYQELSQVEIVQVHTEGVAKYTQAPYNKTFSVNSFFVGSNVRDAVNCGNGDYIPVFLSEIHLLFRRNLLPLDVACIQVSPPDAHGYCSLGTSVDITLPAVETAKMVIAQINKHVPRTHGDGIIHINNIDHAVYHDQPLKISNSGILSEIERKIGYNVASLIDDGATLQMGIGTIPDAVLANLTSHTRLGIHTEMFSNGVLPLIKKGIITGEEKKIKTGKIVTCFSVGNQELYDFVNDNPLVHFKEAGYTNDTAIIRQNDKVTAINSAIEIDITGQICADTIGKKQYSGVGGQMDFIRGAALSKGGKPIFALPSMTQKGISKIVPFLQQGAGVTTTRAHVHYVVTEYGIANLFGQNLKQRAKLLIDIAHPDVRENLEKETWERFK